MFPCVPDASFKSKASLQSSSIPKLAGSFRCTQDPSDSTSPPGHHLNPEEVTVVSQFATGHVSQGTSARPRSWEASPSKTTGSELRWPRARPHFPPEHPGQGSPNPPGRRVSGARQDPTRPGDRTACSQGAVPGERWWRRRTVKNRAARRDAWLRLRSCASRAHFSISFRFLKNGAADNDRLTGQPVRRRQVHCPAHNRPAI